MLPVQQKCSSRSHRYSFSKRTILPHSQSQHGTSKNKHQRCNSHYHDLRKEHWLRGKSFFPSLCKKKEKKRTTGTPFFKMCCCKYNHFRRRKTATARLLGMDQRCTHLFPLHKQCYYAVAIVFLSFMPPKCEPQN